MQISELARLFFVYVEGRNSPGTIGYYRRHIDGFIVHVGDVEVSTLRKHHLLSWGRGWHQIQAVQRLLSWAHVDAELVDRNPFKGVKKPRIGSRKRVLSDRETARILRGAGRVFRDYLLAMRESIARPQEVVALRWSDLRWEHDHRDAESALLAGDAYFELAEYKSRERRADPDVPRIILVTPRLGRLLVRLRRRPCFDPSGPVFLNSLGRPWTTNAARIRMWKLRARLGLGLDGRGEPVVCYTFRHTGATRKTIAGVPDRLLAEIMGHTSTRTTARYQHPARDHLREALNRNPKKLRR